MNTGKKTSISKTIIVRLAICTLILNVVLLLIVGTATRNAMLSKEEEFLLEISQSITNSVMVTMEEYTCVAQVLSFDSSVVSLLENSNQAMPMHSHQEASDVVGTMSKVASQWSAILNVGLMDLEQDGYLLHSGDYSGDSFSFASRPYFSVMSTKQPVITTPYVDEATGSLVVTIAVPVLASGGNALGAVVVDLAIDFVADMVIANHFGDSGSSVVIDGSGMVMGHENKSVLGQNYGTLNISGSELEQQLQSPTRTMVEFQMDKVARVGEVSKVGDMDWYLITSLDESEYVGESNRILSLLFLMLLLTAVVTFAIVVFTVKFSLAPLKDITGAMRGLSKGELHYKLDYRSNNEIGQLAEDLRSTISSLGQYIDEIQRMLNQCGEGNFTVSSELDFKGDFSNISHAIEDFKVLISSVLGGIKATVDQVSIGSDYVATGSQTLAEGSMKQSDSVQQLHRHITEIAEKVKNNVETVRTVNETSQSMSQGLQLGSSQMDDMVRSMEEISQASEGVQKIIKTIEDVAFQTNILALNAAVEAARAGTAGRGFAVVAEEVRNLATRTSVAVKETTTLIGTTVVAVKEGEAIVEGTVAGLQAVVGNLEEFMASLQEITEASEEQGKAIESIRRDMTEITDVTQQNSAISEESAATSEELSSQAAVMKETISQLKTLQPSLGSR